MESKETLSISTGIAVVVNAAIQFANVLKQDSMLIIAIAMLLIVFVVTVQRLIKLDLFKRINSIIILMVFLMLVASAVVAWSWLAEFKIKTIEVNITNPSGGDNVTMRYVVKGTVSDPSSRIYVIVHPLLRTDMWVSYPSMVSPDGKWQDDVYFGTETLGIDEQYEITAIATNENFLVTLATGNFLHEGQIIPTLPRNTNKADVVTVFRPK